MAKQANNVGLARGTVRLDEYNSQWPILFEAEAKAIAEALNIPVASIAHVGSTSIPGMVAKPIIDIAIPVESLDIAEVWKDRLADIGYWYKGVQPDMPDRRFFAKGPDDARIVYLHVVNQAEYDRIVGFRDYLRTNEGAATEYAVLKQQLAHANPTNRNQYTKMKDDFIQRILLQRGTPS